MGIFKTEDCPICGTPTGAMSKSSAKYNGLYVCQDCAKKLSANKISLIRLKKYPLEELQKIVNAETEKTVPVRMILVKNPAGCSQTIDYLSRIDEDFLLVICLNDRTADGHDISWIWDADYERLSENTHIQSMIVSGDRAEDLRVRLKYAGIDEKKIAMEKDNESLLSSMRSSTLPVFVMPNYTSMLALRKILSDATGKREFWEKQS